LPRIDAPDGVRTTAHHKANSMRESADAMLVGCAVRMGQTHGRVGYQAGRNDPAVASDRSARVVYCTKSRRFRGLVPTGAMRSDFGALSC
jgi:hypothetical protein